MQYNQPVVTEVALDADKPSPQPVGTQVTFNAFASGSSNPLYQFWVGDPDELWMASGDFSATATYTIEGSKSGTFIIGVYAKDATAHEWQVNERMTFNFEEYAKENIEENIEQYNSDNPEVEKETSPVEDESLSGENKSIDEPSTMENESLSKANCYCHPVTSSNRCC